MRKLCNTIGLFIFLISSAMAMKHSTYCRHLESALKNGNTAAFLSAVTREYIKGCKVVNPEFTPENAAKVAMLTRQFIFARVVNENKLAEYKEFIVWLLKNPPEWNKLVDNLKPEDNVPNVFKTLSELCKNDLKRAEHYFNLMLAVSLVWDNPRPRIHGQMGEKVLDSNTSPVELYNYFSKLYDTTKAGVRYKELTVSDLIFVVNTPVPITELQWALKHVRGSHKTWGKKYGQIKYDTPRLETNELCWPGYNGVYTLENIEEYGGICVDQAYYTVMTGRARGIPMMYMGGGGSGGGHAWAGLYLDENKWDLAVGGGGDAFAVAHITNPQTDKAMTDHQVDFMCDRKFRLRAYQKAPPFVLAAQNLYQLGEKKLAYDYASLVRVHAPLNLENWQVLEDWLNEQEQLEAVRELLVNKLRVFRKYPDILAETERRYADLLLKLGNAKRAELVLKKSARKQDGERIDLQQAMVMARAKALEALGKYKEALKVLEKFIYGQRNELANIYTAMHEYINFTNRHQLQKEGCHFIKRIYGKMDGKAGDLVIEELMAMMKKAYENAGDIRGLAKINKEIKEYREERKRIAAKRRKRDKRRQITEEDEYEHQY